MSRLKIVAAAAALTATAALASPARAETPVKFVLDWVIMGNHVPFSNALAKGFYKEQGLEVTIDRGYGSADTIGKVGNGLYDFGFADPNLLVKYDHDHPEQAVVLVFLVYDKGQSAIVARKAAGIATDKDLEGKKIGAPPGDNSRQLFPVYAKKAGIDLSKINWVSAQPAIENTMLSRGEVDALTTLEPTTMLALKKLGTDTSTVVSFRYDKYLPELLGEGIITTEKTIKTRPELVRAFLRAVIKGEQDALAHPEAAAKTLTSLTQLVNTDEELTRFRMTMEMSMSDPKLRTNGLGSASPERIKAAAADMAETFEVPMPTDLSLLYNESFLPPVKDRLF